MDPGEAGCAKAGSPGDLCDSVANYSGELGRWWYAQAQNPCHRYAYRNIAGYLRASFPHSPGLIVDYACGAGHLLAQLCMRFPKSRLMGLDGSGFLLDRARRRISRLGRRAVRRITLVETLLPDFASRQPCADVVVFGFPNMVPAAGAEGVNLSESYLGSADLAAAQVLARASGPNGACHVEGMARLRDELLLGRLVSLNLRRLLKRGGVCVRIEYAKVRRQQLSRVDFMRIAFEEGSLDVEVDGILPAQWFRVRASSFFPSRVTEDVYQQTGDESDRGGGYVITVLRRCA